MYYSRLLVFRMLETHAYNELGGYILNVDTGDWFLGPWFDGVKELISYDTEILP